MTTLWTFRPSAVLPAAFAFYRIVRWIEIGDGDGIGAGVTTETRFGEAPGNAGMDWEVETATVLEDSSACVDSTLAAVSCEVGSCWAVVVVLEGAASASTRSCTRGMHVSEEGDMSRQARRRRRSKHAVMDSKDGNAITHDMVAAGGMKRG